MEIELLESQLIIGTKIKIGKKYSEENDSFEEGQIIELVEGSFERDNGLYTEFETAPSWRESDDDDFDSIYHLFGNKFENWHDCEIVEVGKEKNVLLKSVG